MSGFFEEVIDALASDPAAIQDKRVYRVDELDCLLTGEFSKRDLAKDPRLAHIMGER